MDITSILDALTEVEEERKKDVQVALRQHEIMIAESARAKDPFAPLPGQGEHSLELHSAIVNSEMKRLQPKKSGKQSFTSSKLNRKAKRRDKRNANKAESYSDKSESKTHQQLIKKRQKRRAKQY